MMISGISSTTNGFYGVFGMAPSRAASGSAEDETKNVPEDASQGKQDKNDGALSEADLRKVDEMKATDRKVRQHEQAHMAAGGGLTSGASYQYATGPDGQRYAVSGEVGISTSPGRNPAETQGIAARIRAAALAPADPSPQDRKVAAQAAQMQMQAAMEMATQSQRPGTPGDGTQEQGADTEKVAGAGIDAYRMMTRAGFASGGLSVRA